MADDELGMSPMREAAVQMHELYTELRASGFSRSETMELLAKVLAESINAAGNE